MALELLLSSLPPFTIFSPHPKPSPHLHRTPSELRFSRWNNANAQPFIREQRAIKEIEDEIRRERRFDAANTISQNYKPTTTTKTLTATNENFKSIGTPSSPSRPSIPGKKSKYSKPPKHDSSPYHPAFRRIHKAAPKLPVSEETGSGSVRIKVGKDGVSYRIPNAPFEFQYSYTETPKLKPLGFREAPYAPFGPSTMPRPWTGRAPLQKKKLPEFDSFKLPPPHKKGVKPVQAPGPFLAGMGTKHAKTREEILGDPLTDEEKRALIQGVMKSRKQMNMGRDGLTHNMLDNIHDHWKRQRVCKIKCKGVCTVDMDNVRKQLEEKTGGKVIYTRGGLLFLYRGRNFNYRYRPRFPLMLWKPVTPVYPRLIKQPPEGLTMEEARMMCKRGRELPAICKLGKNGVYLDLVRHVREAFEECELVRVDCQGLNGSDYRRIGAKLQDLVPCVLITFQNESILMWRGRDWKSSLLKLEDNSMEVNTSVTEGVPVSPPNNGDSLEDEEKSDLFVQKSSYEDASLEMPPYTCSALPNESLPSLDSDDVNLERTRVSESEVKSFAAAPVSSSTMDNYVASSTSDSIDSNDHQPVTMADVPVVDRSATTVKILQGPVKYLECASAAPAQLHGLAPPSGIITSDKIQDSSEGLRSRTKRVQANSFCMEGVMLLRKQAIESGSAVILDDEILDASIVYERAVALANVAPVGPVFMHGPRKVKVQEFLKKHNGELEVKEVASVEEKKLAKRNSSSYRLKDFKEVDLDRVPHGTLGVDELSKLLV